MYKKVVFVSCFDAYENRIRFLRKYFENNGYKSKYIYSDYDHFKKEYSKKRYREAIRIHVNKYKKNISISRLISHFVFSKNTMKYIKKMQPEIIYAIVPPNYLVKELSRYKRMHSKVKIVFDVYDLWPESFPCSKKTKLFRPPFRVWGNLRSKNVSEADVIVCVSQQEKDILDKEAVDTPVNVLKPVIATSDIPDYKTDIDSLSFCYLGMVNHITDIDLGVNLLTGISKYRHTILHIIGEGQNLSEFVRRLENQGVEVICHGCVFDREKKNEIFSMCNMGLNIPREEIDSTMSLKAVEYLSAGLPFINSAKGDIRKIVHEDNIGINVEDSVNRTVDMVLSADKDTFVNMHCNCIGSYEKRFTDQDLEELLGDLLEK